MLTLIQSVRCIGLLWRSGVTEIEGSIPVRESDPLLPRLRKAVGAQISPS